MAVVGEALVPGKVEAKEALAVEHEGHRAQVEAHGLAVDLEQSAAPGGGR